MIQHITKKSRNANDCDVCELPLEIWQIITLFVISFEGWFDNISLLLCTNKMFYNIIINEGLRYIESKIGDIKPLMIMKCEDFKRRLTLVQFEDIVTIVHFCTKQIMDNNNITLDNVTLDNVTLDNITLDNETPKEEILHIETNFAYNTPTTSERIIIYLTPHMLKNITCCTCQKYTIYSFTVFPMICSLCNSKECNECFKRLICNICIQYEEMDYICSKCYQKNYPNDIINQCYRCGYGICKKHGIQRENLHFCNHKMNNDYKDNPCKQEFMYRLIIK